MRWRQHLWFMRNWKQAVVAQTVRHCGTAAAANFLRISTHLV
jgi:hypothetical protein